MKSFHRLVRAGAIAAAFVFLGSVLTAEETKTYEDRIEAVKAAIMAKRSEGPEAFFAELESQARALLKDFPDRSDPYEMLLAVAQNSEGEKAKALLKELNESKAPEQVKAAAKGMSAKLEAMGKPVEIQFEAIDGRKVDVSSMKGKVVLIDFWATWCGPCVGEIPHVKEAYEKLHPKGFEIVGISFDKDEQALKNFVKEKDMAWPQYFDGKGWQNAFGQKYGINSIPAMWLVDKNGNLADMNARQDLAGKVEKLLAQ